MPYLLSASQRTPTRDIPGTTSVSNSSRFPLNSRVSLVSPVIFPPGRAKLSIIPVATGSPVVTMTMGIVLVACLAARIAAGSCKDKHIDLELHEFGHKAGDTVQLSLSVAILNQDVFPLDVTEISQPLPECLDLDQDGGAGGATSRQKSYPRDFLRLLRLGGNSK